MSPTRSTVHEQSDPADATREAQNDWPCSTYRLQFHSAFTFRDATAVIPYLSKLGITHIYASPILKARPGSMHGYDVVDPHVLNPELGSSEDFDGYVRALAAHGLKQIVDVVPNHMGIGTNENSWWNDCLENGPASRHAEYFDIIWQDPAHPELQDKILLPVLGEPYGSALEKGKLHLTFERGSFAVNYYERRFPLSPVTYRMILLHRLDQLRRSLADDPTSLQKFEKLADEPASLAGKLQLASLLEQNAILSGFAIENLKIFNGFVGDQRSFDLLDDLLGRQFFRLAHWRAARDEINYRRFFDINDLAALRMDRFDVFEESHSLILRLIVERKIAGLRIDHPDGLLDPAEYFLRLRRATALNDAPGSASRCPPFYVVAEKILAANEPLPRSWAVHGTTGYDYINKINGLFVDSASKEIFTRHYSDWVSSEGSFQTLCIETKHQILRESLTSEWDRLSQLLKILGRQQRHWRDFTFNQIRSALAELIAVFPVYRTYVSDRNISACDESAVRSATTTAIERNPAIDPAVFHFLQDVILLKYPVALSNEGRSAQSAIAGKFQQLTAPVTAKGVEDTAFYIYNRLVSLNEVGGDPDCFGMPPAALHGWLLDRQCRWPGSLSPLSTHDTKRSEDVRARINVLSEFPDEWWQRAARWSRLNEPHRRSVDGQMAPAANDEILIYQTIVGAWPIDDAAHSTPAKFVQRIQEYMRKAVREARVHSSWIDPRQDYEEAVSDFVAAILSVEESPLFLQDFRAFQRRVSHFGLLNSLSQTLLRLTAPGVPDTYQGTELWDFSLVDPDNRRPVDYKKRTDLLAAIHDAFALDPLNLARDLIAAKEDGRAKLFVTWILLELRRSRPALFQFGAYSRVEVEGSRREHIFSFIRRHGATTVVVMIPRLLTRLGPAGDFRPGGEAWSDTRISLPPDLPDGVFRNCFTSETIVPDRGEKGRGIKASRAFSSFPIALMILEAESQASL